MAKRGGFPGGGMPGNMSNLMKQAQRMQQFQKCFRLFQRLLLSHIHQLEADGFPIYFFHFALFFND